MILELAIRCGIWFWTIIFFLITIQIVRTVHRGARAGRRDYRNAIKRSRNLYRSTCNPRRQEGAIVILAIALAALTACRPADPVPARTRALPPAPPALPARAEFIGPRQQFIPVPPRPGATTVVVTFPVGLTKLYTATNLAGPWTELVLDFGDSPTGRSTNGLTVTGGAITLITPITPNRPIQLFTTITTTTNP